MEYLIGPVLTFIIVVAGFAVAWGKLNTRLDAIEGCTERIERSCLQYRTTCQNNNHQELARLATAIEDLSQRKEHRWEELDKALSNIDKFIGRVEQYMIMRNGIRTEHDIGNMGGKMR